MINRIAALINQTNGLHLPLPYDPAGAWYKEWYHFCILAPEVEIVINFNLSRDVRPATPGDQLTARVILLAHENGRGWDGDVDTIPLRDVDFQIERIDLQFGHNRLRFHGGAFHISTALQARPVTLNLTLEPRTMPLLMRNNTPVGQGQINWFVLPRLAAAGTLVVEDRVYRLENCPAYHDHNWGSWLWGHNLAWEWGFALPQSWDVPWCIVYDRTTDRRRSKLWELTLAVWKGESLTRVFSQRDVEAQGEGYRREHTLPKFPRVMTLLAPQTTSDIPRQLSIRGGNGHDELLLRLDTAAAAQIVIPNETDLENTIINEVTGGMAVQGRIRGEAFKWNGRAFFEFLT